VRSIRFFAEARLEHEGLDCIVGIDGMVATIAREMSPVEGSVA